nr:hypothetical protein [Tanacetum cinerariifolium]
FILHALSNIGATVKAKIVNEEVQLQALVDGKKVIITESTIRRDLQLEDAEGTDCLPNAAIFEQLTLMRAATTATSLDAEHDRDKIFKTQSKATPNEPGSQGAILGGGHRAATTATSLDAEHNRDKIFKTQSKATPNEPGSQGAILGGGHRRVKKLERRKRSITHELKRLYKVKLSARVETFEDEGLGEEDASKQEKIDDIDANEDITLVSTHDEQMFYVNHDLHGEEVFVTQKDKNVVEKEVDAAQIQVTTTAITPTISIDEVTLAQALAELKHTKPKAKVKGIVFHEPEESTITKTTAIPKPRSQDNGKAKIIEEPIKLKKKDQIHLDEEVAFKLQAELQAEFEKEQRLANYLLDERLQVEEQQQLNDKEKATLLMQLLQKKKKFLAAKRAEEKRNKPPTQAQQRKIMCTYLKNIEGKKLTNLKNKFFDSIQKMFDRAFKRVNTFVDYRIELVEESSKKAEGSLKRAG